MKTVSAIAFLLFVAGCASGNTTMTEPTSSSAPEAKAAFDPGCEDNCGMSGECSMKEGKCVATEEGCRLSAGCKMGGNCVVKDDMCAPK